MLQNRRSNEAVSIHVATGKASKGADLKRKESSRLMVGNGFEKRASVHVLWFIMQIAE